MNPIISEQKINVREFLVKLINAVCEKDRENNYEFIVLTTRRCFCLFSAFCKDPRIKNDFKEWYEKNKDHISELMKKVVSSQKIDIVGNDFNEKKVLLVDDIMIHGRSVALIYDKINAYAPESVDTLVLIRNTESPDYYRFITQKGYSFVYKYVNTDWKEISNSIVDYLHSVGQLYISFIYGYELYDYEFDKIKNINGLKEINIDLKKLVTHKTYEEECQPKYYLYEFSSNYKFLKYASVRVYSHRSYTDSSIFTHNIVPYVELNDFSVSMIDKMWKMIWKTRNNISSYLQKFVTPVDKYKALTAIVSFVLYRKFFDYHKNESNEIDRSFILDFIGLVSENLNDDILGIINNCYCEKINEIKNEVNPNSIMYENISILKSQKVSSILERLKQYFHKVSQNEETEFLEAISSGVVDNKLQHLNSLAIKRFETLRTELLYAQFNNEERKIVYVLMLYLLDNGVASHIIKQSEDCVFVTVKAGEQSYHLFADLTGIAFKSVYLLLDFIQSKNDQAIRNKIKKEFISKIERFRSEFDSSLYDSMIFAIENPPVDLQADYFGILDRYEASLEESDFDEEERIMDIFFDVLAEIK